MAIRIEEKALVWLAEKKRTQVLIDVEFVQINTCCCSRLITFNITYGAPKDPNAYWSEIIDGIQVFLPESVKLPEEREVSIKLKSTLGIKSLTVEGLTQEKIFAC